MMTVKIFDSEDSITIEDIKQAEMKIGKKLPKEYIDFLLMHNGGKIKPKHFNITWANQEWADDGTGGMIHYLLSINGEEAVDFVTEHTVTYEDRIPQSTIIIGFDPGRSLILMGVSNENLGQIFFWNGEYEKDEDDDSAPNFDNIGFIANSLQEFLNNLHEQ